MKKISKKISLLVTCPKCDDGMTATKMMARRKRKSLKERIVGGTKYGHYVHCEYQWNKFVPLVTLSYPNMSGEDVYKDLIGFLQSDRADLRIKASEAVLQVTDRDAMSSLIKYGAIKPLCRLASRSNEPSGISALEALVQLSSHGTSIHQCIEDILDCGGINRMTEIALTRGDDEAWRKRVNYALALLANMTRTERGSIELCGFTMPEEAVTISNVEEKAEEEEKAKLPSKPTMALLTAMFLNGGHIKEKADEEDEQNKEKEEIVDNELNIEKIAASTDDPFQHFAAILMNATQVEQGRRFVMRIHQKDNKTKGKSILERILPELRSTNPIRRRGIAGTGKNCCFDKNAAWWLIHEIEIVQKILYPLAGPEELDMDDKRGMDPDFWLEGPDKVREPDIVTRLLLVEAILLLCASGRRSREPIRVQRTYVILKMMDLSEESEEISERVSECVQYLRRDEDGTSEGSSDRMMYGTVSVNGKMLALPAPSASEQVGGKNENYDDVD